MHTYNIQKVAMSLTDRSSSGDRFDNHGSGLRRSTSLASNLCHVCSCYERVQTDRQSIYSPLHSRRYLQLGSLQHVVELLFLDSLAAAQLGAEGRLGRLGVLEELQLLSKSGRQKAGWDERAEGLHGAVTEPGGVDHLIVQAAQLSDLLL